MNRIIVEGITGTGKTTILNMYNDITGLEKKDSIILSQFYTSSVAFKDETLIAKNKVKKNMKKITGMIIWLDELYELYGNSNYKSKVDVFLETFHIENFIKYNISDYSLFEEIDSLLFQMGFKLIVLYLPENSIKVRSIELTKKHRNSQSWNVYLDDLEKRNGAINYFIDIQQRILNLSQHSKLPKMYIDTQNMEWEKYLENILLF